MRKYSSYKLYLCKNEYGDACYAEIPECLIQYKLAFEKGLSLALDTTTATYLIEAEEERAKDLITTSFIKYLISESKLSDFLLKHMNKIMFDLSTEETLKTVQEQIVRQYFNNITSINLDKTIKMLDIEKVIEQYTYITIEHELKEYKNRLNKVEL